jgi:uncharacterized repeat protein (TIGR01451 family)
VQSCSTTLSANKAVSVISDPAGNASPYALPGAVVGYEFDIRNPGQPIDAATLVLADQLPAGVALVVAGAGAFRFLDGMPVSGLGFTWGGPGDTGDSVEFSTDGADFTYTPTAAGPNATDPAVTHVRFQPSGTFRAFGAGQTPRFRIQFSAEVE